MYHCSYIFTDLACSSGWCQARVCSLSMTPNGPTLQGPSGSASPKKKYILKVIKDTNNFIWQINDFVNQINVMGPTRSSKSILNLLNSKANSMRDSMLETNLGLLKKATEVKLVETTNALPDTVAKQFPEDSLHLTHPEIELRFIAIFQRYIHISDNGRVLRPHCASWGIWKDHTGCHRRT